MSAILLACGTMLPGSAHAQQAPAANVQQSTSTTQSSSGTATHRAPSRSQSALPLTTEKAKASYAMGVNLGTSLKQKSVDIDPAIFERGMKDALAGTKPQLTPDEMKTVLVELQKEVNQQQQVKLAAEADSNKKAGDAFLAVNRTKPGVVTLPSGLQYKILQPGAGPKPTPTDVVVLNYRGSLINGQEFASSKPDQPLVIPVNRVFKGLTEALQLMPVGSKWELYLPPDLGLGNQPGPFGPEATLIFDVELLSIKAPNQPASFGKPTLDNPGAQPQSSPQSPPSARPPTP